MPNEVKHTFDFAVQQPPTQVEEPVQRTPRRFDFGTAPAGNLSLGTTEPPQEVSDARGLRHAQSIIDRQRAEAPQLSNLPEDHKTPKELTDTQKEQDSAKLLNILSIAEVTDLPITEVAENYNTLSADASVISQLGFNRDPTALEVAEGMMIPAVGIAAFMNPVSTLYNVGKFALIDKAIPTEKLVPENAPQQVKDMVRVADFAAKAALLGGLNKAFAAKKSKLVDKDFDVMFEDIRAKKPEMVEQIKKQASFRGSDADAEIVTDKAVSMLETELRASPQLRAKLEKRHSFLNMLKEDLKSKKGLADFVPEKKPVEVKITEKEPVKKTPVISEKPLAKPLPPSKVKPAIAKTTGIAKVTEPVETTDVKQLVFKLKEQAKGAKKGLVEGKKEVVGAVAKEKLKAGEKLQEVKRGGELSLLKQAIRGRQAVTKVKEVLGAKVAKEDLKITERIEKLERDKELGLLKEDIRRRQELSKLKEDFKTRDIKIKERKQTSEDVKKMIKFVQKTPTQNLPPEHRALIEEIKQSVDFDKVRLGNVIKRTKIAKQFENDLLVENLNDLSSISADRMTVGDLKLVEKTIKQLVHQGRTQNEFLVVEKQKNFEEAVVKGVTSLNESGVGQGPTNIEKLPKGFGAKSKNFASKFIAGEQTT